jgi:hypothetical protein
VCRVLLTDIGQYAPLHTQPGDDKRCIHGHFMSGEQNGDLLRLGSCPFEW